MSPFRSFALYVSLPLGAALAAFPSLSLRAQSGAAGTTSRAAALSPHQRTRIDRVFKAYDKPDVPGCALGVFRDGKIAYARGYGFADLERHVPITPATLFDVGSTSKQFAAASVILLAEEGKLSLGDDIRKYIPELPDYGTPITIDNLLRHTSGLRDYDGLLDLAGHGLEEVTTDSQALALVASQRHLNFPTGTRYSYSNTGYFLMSVVVQRVTGKSLTDFAHERIFLPLGMTHTRYRNKAAMLIPGRALGYAPDDKAGFRNSMSNWEETGDGSVHISVDDALKWDENFYHPRVAVGGAALVAQLQQRGTLNNGDTINYARGLSVDHYRGLRRVEHGGAWIGYRAAFNRFPDKHTSVVIFCNSDAIEPGSLADQVTDIVLGGSFLEKREPSEATTRTASVRTTAGRLSPDQVVGSYYVAENDELWRIMKRDGALVLRLSGQSFPLAPNGPSTFAVTGFPGNVEFLLGGNGAVRALQLRAGSDTLPEAVRFTPAVVAPDGLQEYAGSYYSPELDVTWLVAMAKGQLVFRNPKSAAPVDIGRELEPAMPDVFDVGGGSALIRFTRDQSGRVTGFGLSASRMRNIRFDLSASHR